MDILFEGKRYSLGGGSSAEFEGISVKPVTQAEYDALSEEEKNSETAWLVTDAESTGAGSSSNSSDEVYSEEEAVIGTFLGKPLYRKVIVTKAPAKKVSYDTTESTLWSGYRSLMVDTLVRFDGIIQQDETFETAIASGFKAISLAGDSREFSMIVNGNSIYCQFEYGILCGNRLIIILEYTKTTD